MTKFFLSAWHLVYHLGKNQQRQNALELDYYFSNFIHYFILSYFIILRIRKIIYCRYNSLFK